MSNSALVNYTKISPNSNNPRNMPIKKITVHHMAGNLSVEACGALFASSARGASSNYGIGSDGRVGLYVEEKNRSWCSSSPANDHQAITIEVANDGGAPNWHVSDLALAKTIDLCVDICKRNKIAQLNFTGNANGNFTQHNFFAATACPGPYLKSQYQYIVNEVNKRLAIVTSPGIVVGSIVTIREKAHYGGLTFARGKLVPVAQLYPKKHTVSKIQRNNGSNEALLKEISSWVPIADLQLVL